MKNILTIVLIIILTMFIVLAFLNPKNISEIITGSIALISIISTTYMAIENRKANEKEKEKDRLHGLKQDTLKDIYSQKVLFYLELTKKIKDYKRALINEDDEDVLYNWNGEMYEIKGLTKEKIYYESLVIIQKFIENNLIFLEDELMKNFLFIKKELKKTWAEAEYEANHRPEYEVVVHKKVYSRTYKEFEEFINSIEDKFKTINNELKI